MIWVGYLSDRKLKNDRVELHMEQSCTNTRIEWLAKNDRYIEDHTTYIVAGLPPTPR